MKEKFFSLFVFAFFAQLLLGQEKFTIRGEFPDNTLDGKYVLLIDKSSLFYEGIVTRKPFFCTNIL